MHTILPLSLVALVSGALLVIGCFYIAAPERVMSSFGLKPPATDRDTLAWLHEKGIRDVVSSLAVLVLWLTTNNRTMAILFLVFALIPLGDMSNVLLSGGRKSTAFSVHGLTCLVMVIAGLLLIHAF